MFRKHHVVFSVATILAFCTTSSSMAADLCEDLVQSAVLHIVGNGFVGSTDRSRGIVVKKGADGVYTFQDSIGFINEPRDIIEGTCKDRHIVFTRTRTGPGGFVQKYDGWLFEKNSQGVLAIAPRREIAGTFSANNCEQWGWYGFLYNATLK